jgi:hypothetical protein
VNFARRSHRYSSWLLVETCNVDSELHYRNRGETEWAVSHQRTGCLLFILQSIHLSHEHEYREGNNQEVRESIEEDTVVDRGCSRSFRLSQGGICMPRKVDEFVGKSEWPENRPIGGIRMSETKELTTRPKAAPTIMPTAISSMLPRIAKSLNSPSTP